MDLILERVRALGLQGKVTVSHAFVLTSVDSSRQADLAGRLAELDVALATVAPANGGLRIGAALKLVDLAEHAEVARMYPAITAAAIEVGTPQIRNLGTVGGNLMQRPRCWYFRNEEFPCLKKGGARCYSVDGENQFHAILGGGPCHIVHPSSLAVPIIATIKIVCAHTRSFNALSEFLGE